MAPQTCFPTYYSVFLISLCYFCEKCYTELQDFSQFSPSSHHLSNLASRLPFLPPHIPPPVSFQTPTPFHIHFYAKCWFLPCLWQLVASKEKLSMIESQLKQAISLYKRRLEWLTTERYVIVNGSCLVQQVMLIIQIQQDCSLVINFFCLVAGGFLVS